MKFTVLTLFPALIEPWIREALISRAIERGLLEVEVRDIRDHAHDKHRTVDDTPYGGGAGMVMRVDVVVEAIEAAGAANEVILLTPAGQPLTQALAAQLSQAQHLVLVCGRYEGIDARVEQYVTREVSLGDFVLMGGEVAALALLEATIRLRPGVIGDPRSHQQDSFQTGLLDHPHYTRPPEFRGQAVPEVLLSGNHARIEAWRSQQALERTQRRRPDLLVGPG
jgi:tRNA (guanine37-N1)-methyltransferase